MTTSPLEPFVRDLFPTSAERVLRTPAASVSQPDAAEPYHPSDAAVYGPRSPLRHFEPAEDAFGEPCIFTADPDRPVQLLTRHQLPRTDDGDALWQLICAAVESTADLTHAGDVARGWKA